MHFTASWRPEHRALCEYVSSRVRDRRTPSLPAPASSIDWTFLLDTANSQAVAELLLPGLAREKTSVPREVIEALETRQLGVTALNLARTRQLVELLRLFDDERIRALAFKGPTLAAHVYGHLALRSSSDLDILIDRRHVRKVRALLLAHGYQLPARPRHRGGSLLHGVFPAAGRDDTLAAPTSRLASVDVHAAFSFWTLGIRLDSGPLFDRAILADVAGEAILTLHPDDLLLVLAIHGMMHGWHLLRYVCDVDAVAQHVSDWNLVVTRAEGARMLRVLWVALLVAMRVLRTNIPPEITARASQDATAVRVAGQVVDRLFAPPNRPGEWDPMPWFLSFQERPRDRIRFHTRRIVYEWVLKWPWDEWLGRRSGGEPVARG